MIFILFLQLLFRHVRGDCCETFKADRIERAVLVASVGEEGSGLKCHGEPPEGTQHYTSLVTVYRKAADTHELFIFPIWHSHRRAGDEGKSFGLCFRYSMGENLWKGASGYTFFVRVLRVCSNDREHFRAIFLLLWSGGFIAAPFSVREDGHECLDSPVYPQGNCFSASETARGTELP